MMWPFLFDTQFLLKLLYSFSSFSPCHFFFGGGTPETAAAKLLNRLLLGNQRLSELILTHSLPSPEGCVVPDREIECIF